MPYNSGKDEKDEQRLFKNWLENRDENAANLLVKKYLPLVNIIVDKIQRSLPKSVSKDELFSLGMFGLYEALEKYDPDRQLKFETYASFRIRGSILDGLRKEDWLPRKTREKTKKIEKIIATLEQKYLRNVTVQEVAEEAGMSVSEVSTLLEDSFFANVLSIDDHEHDHEEEMPSFVIRDDEMKTPEEEMVYTENIEELAEAITKLSKKEQYVLSLFYQEDLTFTEIGQILDLSTSRISQIHRKAITKLKQLLRSTV
ncbi:FliA/WhiG family RNA polymerase sigma factor [Fervidibacillus albus]|uniref:RNA polymerase sigma factor n=1 Tax=Fervidibacillus albus TaxID=2980026 RepID=A0A9E8RW14_9BACI|nr:FliA/WhiG family RNA polymerase sigma factor [Fervidibacillus albus]WAA11250.1 FliA/WhiG family RNA polymerase sigma factor [Fervidibacillus albus]